MLVRSLPRLEAVGIGRVGVEIDGNCFGTRVWVRIAKDLPNIEHLNFEPNSKISNQSVSILALMLPRHRNRLVGLLR